MEERNKREESRWKKEYKWTFTGILENEMYIAVVSKGVKA